MILHDFECKSCGYYEEELPLQSGITEVPCPACEEGVMEISYKGWKGLGLVNDGVSVDDRIARDGTVNMMGASDSKLCRIELGLSDKPLDKGLRTFTPEQSMEFRRRIMLEGGKARTERKLFEDIIKTRKENQAKAKAGGK